MSAQNTRCGVRGRRGVPRGWLSPLRRVLSRRRYGVWPTMALPLQIATMALLCCCAFGMSCAMCDEALRTSEHSKNRCAELFNDSVSCTHKLHVLSATPGENKVGRTSVFFFHSAIENTDNMSVADNKGTFKLQRLEVYEDENRTYVNEINIVNYVGKKTIEEYISENTNYPSQPNKPFRIHVRRSGQDGKLQELIYFSPAKILRAVMTHKTITAENRTSAINVTVKNTGDQVSEYVVSITNCHTIIHPLLAQRITIYPQKRYELTFNLSIRANTQNGQKMCAVTLYNSMLELLDQKNVVWNVTALDHITESLPETNETNERHTASTPNAVCTDCSFANVWCAFRDDCLTTLWLSIGITSVVLLMIAIISYVLNQTTDIYQHVSSLMTRLRRRWGNAPGAASGVSKAVASTAPAAQQVQPEMCLGASTEQHTTAPLYDYYSDTTRAALSEPYAVPPAVHADSPSPCRCSGADAHSLPAATVPAHSSSADQLHTVARATETDSDHEPDQYHDGAGGSNVTPAANLDATVIDKPPS